MTIKLYILHKMLQHRQTFWNFGYQYINKQAKTSFFIKENKRHWFWSPSQMEPMSSLFNAHIYKIHLSKIRHCSILLPTQYLASLAKLTDHKFNKYKTPLHSDYIQCTAFWGKNRVRQTTSCWIIQLKAIDWYLLRYWHYHSWTVLCINWTRLPQGCPPDSTEVNNIKLHSLTPSTSPRSFLFATLI